jgi:hypothetical protein
VTSIVLGTEVARASITDTASGAAGAPCDQTGGATATRHTDTNNFLSQDASLDLSKEIASPATALIMKNPSLYA